MKEKIEAALDKVRPQLRMDGVVKVKLTGACGGCPMSQLTLKMGIERILKKEVPEVKEVVAV
jgi:Fe-S cluster biogenesis protein NfuA